MEIYPHTAILPGMNRITIIAVSVVVIHVAALWTLQSGLLRRSAEVVAPMEVMSAFVEPPVPKALPPPRRQPQPAPVRQQTPAAPIQSRPTAPQARPNTEPEPLSTAPLGAPLLASVTPSTAAPAPMTPAPPARIEPPSSDADYLENAKPSYPPMSKRLGEQGKVVIRILIETDGHAHQAEIKQSSGFDRLDQAALSTVLRWRYLPGKRAGTPEAMWFNVPINFVLE